MLKGNPRPQAGQAGVNPGGLEMSLGTSDLKEEVSFT